MAAWQFSVVLDEQADMPLFAQITRAIVADVARGRLRPGDRLPGSRTMAGTLGVHRNTVLAALDELHAQGVVRTEPARGTFIDGAAARVRTPSTKTTAKSTRAGFDLRATPPAWEGVLPSSDNILALQSGVPDVRLVPAAELARAWRRAIMRHGRKLLGYTDAQGHPDLRAAVADYVSSTRGVAVDASQVLIVRGSQMALDLSARALLAPGDIVAVEELGYPPAWRALWSAGAQLVPIPVDSRGMDVDALERITQTMTVRCVVTTPHHQYPTTVTMTQPRRTQLLELCARKRIAVIEDDYDHELHYDGTPVQPLAAMANHGVVVYVGTLSKVLAPGLRLGFVCAPHDVIAQFTALRAHTDRQGDWVLEEAVAELMQDGALARHARRLRRASLQRRDTLVAALDHHFGATLEFSVPRGGMAVWARANVDVDAWAARGLTHGVAFATARRFALNRAALPFVRLGFAALNPEELQRAVSRMKLAFAAPPRQRR